MMARATGDDRPHDLRYDRRDDRSGTATWNEISGDKSDADAVYHRNRKKLPANLHERRGGKRDDIKSDGYGEGVPLFVSLAVFLHASPTIAPACLAVGGELPSRFLVSLGLYEWRGGGPFFVPSPRPVFRCSACPTRLPSRPCPAWQHRCPGACGNQLHDRSRGR